MSGLVCSRSYRDEGWPLLLQMQVLRRSETGSTGQESWAAPALGFCLTITLMGSHSFILTALAIPCGRSAVLSPHPQRGSGNGGHSDDRPFERYPGGVGPQEGAFDYLTKPFDMDELLFQVRRIDEMRVLRRELDTARSERALGNGGIGATWSLPSTPFMRIAPTRSLGALASKPRMLSHARPCRTRDREGLHRGHGHGLRRG